MPADNQPDLGNGKICYIEMPAADVAVSAAFYRDVFGWKVRQRDDGSTAFDDGVGQVSGTWIAGLKPATEGLMVHIMVDDMTVTCALVTQNGGAITQGVGKHLPEITAQFSDPAGNILGLYQQ